MKILVSGFQPFGGGTDNPSMDVLPFLERKGVSTIVLPVSYERSRSTLREALITRKPNLIVSLGLAGGRKEATLERYAYNRMKATVPDEDGNLKTGETIDKKMPYRLETPLPADRLCPSLAEKGHRCRLSLDPGRFICNLVYFLDLSSGIPSLFVHLPAKGSVPLEEDIRLLNDLLDLLA
ncbi:MAG: hypothetical protein LKK13_04960 [Bacilli bacterium]|jgi:pyroglutamyl-peptidase|nr:hypothetical protein [Bacilli bacterium]